jgi:hypothetical protein
MILPHSIPMKLAWQQQPRVQLQLFLGIVGPPHRIHNVYIYIHTQSYCLCCNTGLWSMQLYDIYHVLLM